jgi:radical SAM protein with 4Fe4S-binding SPASM domain
MQRPDVIQYRYEPFGGILHLAKPAALVWVDKDYMRSLGYSDSHLWDRDTDLLTAPTEVHSTLTAQCDAGCKGCYVDSFDPDQHPEKSCKELGFEGHKKVIDGLAEARVFHIAMGGGESMELPWLFDLARYARMRKMVPNLTTNGFRVTPENARECRLFGQVNVSVDGVDSGYDRFRGVTGFAKADRGLTLLKKAGCSVGINMVVSRKNFDQIESVIRYAKSKKLNQIEFLRFKPAGRAVELFQEMDLTLAQSKNFYPMVCKLTKKYRINLRLDCSFMPMVFHHEPDPERVSFFAVAGCMGGNMLMGVKPDGTVNACSFSRAETRNAADLKTWWNTTEAFEAYRDWKAKAPQPCAGCTYLDLCRGGCHVVAEHVWGTVQAPDPGCPKVAAYAGTSTIQ